MRMLNCSQIKILTGLALTGIGALCLPLSARAALVHFYKLDETNGTAVADSAGAAPGTLGPALGDTNWVPAKVNNGLQFPGGVGSYASVPRSAAFDFLAG